MIGFFAKRFIKDSENTHLPAVRAAYGTLCGVAGICFNLLLFACKLFAGVISGAISVVSDAFNNFMDAASSVITLIGFRMSEQKADKDHPFGHGRIEYLSGLLVSLLILLVGFELGKSSIEKIFHPETVTFSPVVAVILALSVAVKLYMAFYNFRIGKLIDSAAVKATGTDSLSDCIATGHRAGMPADLPLYGAAAGRLLRPCGFGVHPVFRVALRQGDHRPSVGQTAQRGVY